jgi:Immunity protein 50
VTDEASPENLVIGHWKLVEVYGYWITFHDASVETVLIEREGPTVTIDFETCDMAYRDGELVENDRRAKVVIRWQGVRELRLEGIDPAGRNWIDGLTWKAQGEDIRGELELMDGLRGTIVAQRVEIVEVEPL